MAEELHAQHRSRLKARFLRDGIKGFEKHNILELLLFFGIPQADTNETAHRLLNRFGSFAGVCDAAYEELVTVNGVKENTAVLLKLIPEIAKLYCFERFAFDSRKPTYAMMGEYYTSHFIGINQEQVMVTYFDEAKNIIDTETLFIGSVNSSALPLKRLVESAILKNSPNVIIAHNHPFGYPIASAEDLDTTCRIRDTLAGLNIRLIDHFIVARNTYGSILHSDKSGFFIA